MIACFIMSLASARANSDLTASQIHMVEQAVDKKISENLNKLNQDSIHTILTKIDTIQMTARLTQLASYTLEYLEYSLKELLEPIVINTSGMINFSTGNQPTNNQQISIINPWLSYIRGPKTILAGQESQIVARYELSALYEDILVKDFVISSSYPIDEVIESVQIYNNSGVKIAQWYPVQNQIIFNNQDILLHQGSHAWYMTITPRKVWYNGSSLSNINYQLQLSITRAIGQTSTDQVSITTSSQTSDSITIYPFIFTAATLTNNRNGNTTDLLLNNGVTRVAILRFSINTSKNTTTNNQSLKAILSEVSLALGNNIAGTINTITIRNINGWTAVNGIINNGKVTFPLTTMPVGERTLESLSEQGFLIMVDANLSANMSESLSLSMDSNSVSFTTNEDNTLYTNLGLGGGYSSSINIKD